MSTPVPTPLSQLLYQMSLEAPGRWWMVMGPGLETDPPYLNVGALASFVTGYQAAIESSGVRAVSDGFFPWLRDEANAFPQQGWARHLLQQSNGDHAVAISALFTHLHRFLLETRPAWFVRFNQQPQQSLFANGLGEHLSADVRLAAHVAAVTGAEPIAPPDIRLSAFEMTDGYVLNVGLPSDVGSWWTGSGRRVAVMGSPVNLSAVRGSVALLSSFFEHVGRPVDACVLDATSDSVAVLCTGDCGATHLRGGGIIALTVADAVSQWVLRPGDRVLLLTKALFVRALELGVGPLPPPLATGEAIAWAQSVDVAARRLAVVIAVPSI